MAHRTREIQRLLLVQPPYTIFRDEAKGCQTPLGLGYLAAVMEPMLDVQVLDAVAEGYATEREERNGQYTYGLTDDEIRYVLTDFRPQMVGVSCLFSTQWRNALRVCRIAKEVDPQIITVTGGAHPSAVPEETLTDVALDFVVMGEGEDTLPALVAALRAGRSFNTIQGIAFREEGRTAIVPRREYIGDLDTLPYPARHLLPMTKYMTINQPHGTVARRTPVASLITSRGCPAHCVFCSIHNVWGRRFRARSPENVLGELESLVRGYGVREVHFEDDNLTFDRRRALAIFGGMIQRGFDLAWAAPNGLAVSTLDLALLEIMKASGCYRVHLAVESGDPEVLHRIIHKPLRLDKVPEVIAAAKQLDLGVDVFLVVGFPGETRDQIQRTFDFARHLDVDSISLFIATPYPGTELAEICRAQGLVSADIPYETMRVHRGNISTAEFTSAELERWVSRETLRLKLRQLARPGVFFERVILRGWRNPSWLLGYGARMVRQWLRPRS